jgi:hypothetical protein
MSDTTNNASGDLSLPGAAPAVPAAPQMSVAEAASRKAEFFADRAKMDALMAGDANVTEEWRNIVNSISAQPPAPTDPLDEAAQHLQQTAGHQLNDFQMLEIQENRPVTSRERHFALSKFEEFKNDQDWVARLNRGESKAKLEWSLVCSILSRPVRDPQQS